MAKAKPMPWRRIQYLVEGEGETKHRSLSLRCLVMIAKAKLMPRRRILYLVGGEGETN